MIQVKIKPEMLRWARERARLGVSALAKDFPKLDSWERGEARPTLKQLERFANTTHAPVGYFFLQEPPIEHVPIPDFRAFRKEPGEHPSPDLLDTLYICQQRQEWYHDFAHSSGEEPFSFVGSVNLENNIVATAASIRQTLGFDVEKRRLMPTWTDALRHFIEQADTLGILVMCSGVVQNNTHRRLDPGEFRGFAMADKLAPLIFINGGDTKAAQMFTLAHELAHIWLGQSAVSDAQALRIPEHKTEQWCNQVAAELLVPAAVLREDYRKSNNLNDEANRLAKLFKVSTLVILRRINDIGGITLRQFQQEYQKELERLLAIPRGSGGNFYLTQAARVSKRFARALVASTLEGQTLHRDAFRLLGFAKLETFHDLGRSLGVTA